MPARRDASGRQRPDRRCLLQHKTGHRVSVNIRISARRGERGEIVGGVGIFNDNSQTLSAIARMEAFEKLAYLDPLTGTANRRFAEITLRARYDEFKRYGWPFGLISPAAPLAPSHRSRYPSERPSRAEMTPRKRSWNAPTGSCARVRTQARPRHCRRVTAFFPGSATVHSILLTLTIARGPDPDGPLVANTQ